MKLERKSELFTILVKSSQNTSPSTNIGEIVLRLSLDDKRLKQYMFYHTTWLITKLDLIKYIFEKSSLSRRIARWQLLISEYGIVYVSQKAIKGSSIVEVLVDQEIEDYKPINFDFPNMDLMAMLENKEEPKEEKHGKCTSTTLQML